MPKQKISLLILSSLLVAVIFIIWQQQLLSPLSKNSGNIFQSSETSKQNHLSVNAPAPIVYGFLPYWNVTSYTPQPELSHLAYFALEIAESGEIVTHTRPGETEPGYLKLNSEAFLNLLDQDDYAIELVCQQFNNEKINAFLTNPNAWQVFFTQLDELMLAYPFSGLNIDFEYQGEVDSEQKQQFSQFIQNLAQHLETTAQQFNQPIQLSVDVYANAGNPQKNLLWDLPALANSVDYIIIMAYDFHYPGSAQAGPVAPIDDINRLLKGFLDQVPKEKILLGLPFYGYAWQTDQLSADANTYPKTGFTVSWQKMGDLLNLRQNWANCQNLEFFWHAESLSPYAQLICPSENSGGTAKSDNPGGIAENYLVHFESPRSLAYKLQLAKDLQLGGIAIWALGYEGQDRQLWAVIADYLAD